MSLFIIPTEMNEKKIQEKIKRLRLGVLVHSVIYYKLNTNIITDIEFDRRSKELQKVQIQYPELSKKVKEYYKEFRNWDGGSGYKLPLDDVWANSKAKYLIELEKIYRKAQNE